METKFLHQQGKKWWRLIWLRPKQPQNNYHFPKGINFVNRKATKFVATSGKEKRIGDSALFSLK
jgi:hypothetical protein